MFTYELEWWDGEEWDGCLIDSDEPVNIVRQNFKREEAEDGKTVEDLTIRRL